MAKAVNVLIADDEKHIRDLIKMLANSLSGVQVVGMASDGEQALELFNQTQPDVVLLDINMPKKSGLEVLREIKKINPAITIVMLTSLNAIDAVREAVEGGADNYLLKNNHPEKIREAIRDVCFRKIAHGGSE